MMETNRTMVKTLEWIILFDEIIFPIYYLIFILITSFSQLSIILLVIFRTPLLFKDFKKFLINSSSLQLLMCVIICFVQVRPVINTNSTAYLFSGPCQYYDKNVCLWSFDFFQLVFDASAFAIPSTLFYKYIKVSRMTRQPVSKIYIRLILLSTYFLSLIVAVIYILTYDPNEALAVEKETMLENNFYNFKSYAGITGNVNNWQNRVINWLNALSIYAPPVISIGLIRLIQRRLKRYQHLFTDKTAMQAKKFDLALTIQTMIPAICVLPAYTVHLLSEEIHFIDLIVQEKAIYNMLALPTAIDAFIVIFTITPYRNSFLFFFIKLKNGKIQPKNNMNVHSRISTL